MIVRSRPTRNDVLQALRESRSAVRGGPARVLRRPTVRVGWVAAETLSSPRRTFRSHQPPVSMRINNTAFWMREHAPTVRTEVYRDARRSDVVVFFKAMDAACQQEARWIQEAGGRVVFDANVNYYEVWGDYDIAGTRPTEEQQRDAIAMTTLADWVVADSSRLLEVVRTVNPRASWIPDNVDLRIFRGLREHRDGPLRLVWSGMAQKAQPLLIIADALSTLRGAELTVVSNEPPAALAALSAEIPCRFVPFSERRYARELLRSDVVISPKRLVNAYELGHTEYKITPGMAVGLPAVASPQQSYVEAISDRGGGIVAESAAAWAAALEQLSDATRRRELGLEAAETVRARYSTDVTSRAYLDTILALVE
jgi:glycosyltransferase involved in cell wall biosynthesis